MLLLLTPAAFIMTISLHAQLNRSENSTGNPDSLSPELRRLLSFDSAQHHFIWPDVVRGSMTSNLDSNYSRILALKKRYKELVPAGYEVYIFFDPAGGSKYGETYDLTIRRKIKGKKLHYREMFDPHGNRSSDLIKAVPGWEYGTIMEIRKLLKEARCAGIENGEVTCIYYMRGYRYLFFPNDLTTAEKEQYDDRKRFFFYGSNIVIDINKRSAESYPLREPS